MFQTLETVFLVDLAAMQNDNREQTTEGTVKISETIRRLCKPVLLQASFLITLRGNMDMEVIKTLPFQPIRVEMTFSVIAPQKE